jgi:hypothetical protein
MLVAPLWFVFKGPTTCTPCPAVTGFPNTLMLVKVSFIRLYFISITSESEDSNTLNIAMRKKFFKNYKKATKGTSPLVA